MCLLLNIRIVHLLNSALQCGILGFQSTVKRPYEHSTSLREPAPALCAADGDAQNLPVNGENVLSKLPMFLVLLSGLAIEGKPTRTIQTHVV